MARINGRSAPPVQFFRITLNVFALADPKGADAVYILGSSLEALRLIALLENALGVPVVQAIAARIWEIQKRLHVHEPIKGYGHLLEALPG
jgi:maleate cis-trans isomerase